MPVRKHRAKLPKVGTVLSRQYLGRTVKATVVEVRPDISRVLVEMEGNRYTSLSAAAKALVGHETNGWQFWGLE
ncbi:MAG: DUF2924 domain-containing protein [Chloroflexota bacterium]|nr:DUF2924 domain-containing protein [Chloroflexota bacterium]